MIQIRQNRISDDDLDAISLLINKGVGLSDILVMIQNEQNTGILQSIILKLNEGENIVDAFENSLNKKLAFSFSFYCRFLSVENSLKCCLNMQKLSKEIKQEVIGKLFYPVLMFTGSLVLVIVFELVFIPMIQNLANSFGLDSIMQIAITLKFLIIFIVFILGVFFFVFIYFIQKSKQSFFYCIWISVFPHSLIKKLATVQFAQYLYQLTKNGCSTLQSIEMLRKLQSAPLVNLLAFHINEQLLMGESFKSAISIKYLDSDFARYMLIGSYADEQLTMLENYILLSKKILNKKLVSFCMMIQLSSYSFVGVVLILMYQILYSPMAILSQM